jgi:serine protease Do
MTKWMLALLIFGFTNTSWAYTTDEIVAKISRHIVKVYVSLPNGYGLGSGVVIAENQVVTNCHVVAGANAVNVMVDEERFIATALIPDWHHDLCILKVEGLKVPIAPIASSEALQYEQAVYSIGFAGGSPRANATFGVIKSLYPMDDSVVIRASNTFRLGDSGGGLFDEQGNLVGVIAVKSPGQNANYYNMSVEWVKKLMAGNEQKINIAGELPFWAESPEKWPYFMRIVHPYKTESWAKLDEVASQWIGEEPTNTEAQFYKGVAAFNLRQVALAEKYLNQVVHNNLNHTDALYYLGLIEEENGNHDKALEMVAMLNHIDAISAGNLSEKIGLSVNNK